MTVEEKVVKGLRALPASLQARVLDYVEYLRQSAVAGREDEDDLDWSAFSLAQAMRGMEAEDSLYTTDDLKEVFE